MEIYHALADAHCFHMIKFNGKEVVLLGEKHPETYYTN